MDYQELAFKLVGLVVQSGELVAFRVLVRGYQQSIIRQAYAVIVQGNMEQECIRQLGHRRDGGRR